MIKKLEAGIEDCTVKEKKSITSYPAYGETTFKNRTIGVLFFEESTGIVVKSSDTTINPIGQYLNIWTMELFEEVPGRTITLVVNT